MASRSGRAGKSRDLSSAWSEFTWNEGGYWISSRYNESGKIEYTRRYPENTEPTTEQRASTPRSTPDPTKTFGVSYATDSQVGVNASPPEDQFYTTSRTAYFPASSGNILPLTTSTSISPAVESLSNRLQNSTLNEDPASNNVERLHERSGSGLPGQTSLPISPIWNTAVSPYAPSGNIGLSATGSSNVATTSANPYAPLVDPRFSAEPATTSTAYNYNTAGRASSSAVSQTSSAYNEGMNSTGVERSYLTSSVPEESATLGKYTLASLETCYSETTDLL